MLLGKGQSPLQIVSLIMLLFSALLIEGSILDVNLGGVDGGFGGGLEHFLTAERMTFGVVPCLLASLLSGLAGAISQKFLQGAGSRNSYLFSMEISSFSCITMLFTLLGSDDGRDALTRGLLHNWQVTTLLPIISNAAGGIIVGLVTKYAGSVRKGFALIFGIIITVTVQAVTGEENITWNQSIGATVVVIAMYMHAKFNISSSPPPSIPKHPTKYTKAVTMKHKKLPTKNKSE